MFDYSLNEEDRKNYVLKYYVSKDNKEIQVEFPKRNGKLRVFKNLRFCSENIEALNKKQEEQVGKALQKINKFKTRCSIFKGLTLMTFGGESLITGLYLSSPSSSNYSLIAIGLGGILLLKNGYNLVKSTRKVKELEKLELLEENKEALNSVLDYPNGLIGLNNKVAQRIGSEDKPFNYNNIDEYSKGDLETILSNINTEQSFCFDYNKGKVKTK